MREKDIKRQVRKQLKKEFPNWRRLPGKVRTYAELDADPASGAGQGMNRGPSQVIVSGDKLFGWTDGRRILYHPDIIEKVSFIREFLQKPLNAIPAKPVPPKAGSGNPKFFKDFLDPTPARR